MDSIYVELPNWVYVVGGIGSVSAIAWGAWSNIQIKKKREKNNQL